MEGKSQQAGPATVRRFAQKRTQGPDRHFRAGSVTDPGILRFRKHRRPCGQPVVDGVGFLRPLPLQAGHFKRMKATPSDLPLMSTGLAMYPVPPQSGQSFGFTPSPLSCCYCSTTHRQDGPQTKKCYEIRTRPRAWRSSAVVWHSAERPQSLLTIVWGLALRQFSWACVLWLRRDGGV